MTPALEWAKSVWAKRPQDPASYWLTRFIFLRFLGLIYFFAFLSLAVQFKPLLGSAGLLPVGLFLSRVRDAYPAPLSHFLLAPSIFWAGASDGLMRSLAWMGVGLSLAVLLGFANAVVLAALWILYSSFANVGQLFYGYGWEMMTLEAGFLAIFLCPLFDPKPFSKDVPPSKIVIWMLRWMLFRTMFGAGMIKMRGDPCWKDLTCLYYHFETQPIPNPLSLYFHRLPHALLRFGVLFNHFTELVAPWFAFGPRRLRTLAGWAIVSFQIVLILSGNLSWLNWLTIGIAVSCFDDKTLSIFFPKKWLRAIFPPTVTPAQAGGQVHGLLDFRFRENDDGDTNASRRIVLGLLTAVIAVLSIRPALNLFSSRQIMNGSFDPFHLVNTYGAFGTVGRDRLQIVIEGTEDAVPNEWARWKEYEFLCQPGDVMRRPCVVSPFQPRIDWQAWFAAMEDYSTNPWLVHLVWKLLTGDPGTAGLFAKVPFVETPPRFVRILLYRYRFAAPGDTSRAWWRRELLGTYLPPLSTDNPSLRAFIQANGWRN